MRLNFMRYNSLKVGMRDLTPYMVLGTSNHTEPYLGLHPDGETMRDGLEPPTSCVLLQSLYPTELPHREPYIIILIFS
jgi:hypothetical protein